MSISVQNSSLRESPETSVPTDPLYSISRPKGVDQEFRSFLMEALADLSPAVSASGVLKLAKASEEWWREHACGPTITDYSQRVREELSLHAASLQDTPTHGVLLLGGAGSRLGAYTQHLHKHLLPAYDQPVCFHSLSALMMTGARDISVVTTPQTAALYRELLGDGSELGINLSYVLQREPKGIAHAVAQIGDIATASRVTIALGDNVLYGIGVAPALAKFPNPPNGARAFTCRVNDPFHFEVVDYDAQGLVSHLSLKPEIPSSSQVLVGLLRYDGTIVRRADECRMGYSGEHQLHDVHLSLLKEGAFSATPLSPAVRWFDTGREESLFQCSLQLALDAHGGESPLSPRVVAECLGWIPGRHQ